MKCPKCRREIPFDAVKHDVCGWAVTSGGVNASRALTDSECMRAYEPTATREQIEAGLAKLRAIVRRPYVPPEPMKDRGRPAPPLLADVGHGNNCTCEVCYRSRLPGGVRRFDAEKSDAKIKQVPETRLERLRKLFPVEV